MPRNIVYFQYAVLGKAATARKPSKIKGYSDFMIFPQNKKFPLNLVFGDFLCFWEHFWEIGGGGVSLPQRGGMAKINIHLQKLGNWFFTQIYFLIF